MSIKQSELAEKLGVSQYTVSVALGGKGRISERMRRRVLKAADDLGYRVNPLAAGLRGAKTGTVGMIWHFVNPWAEDAMVALELLEYLESRGYTAYQAQHREDPKRMCDQLDGFLARQVDAIIISCQPSQLEDPDIRRRFEAGTPIIAVSREDVQSFPGDLIVHDRNQAIRQIVEYFARTGRKRLSFFLSCMQESNPPKIAAFKTACMEFGLEAHSKLVVDLDYPTSAEETGLRHERALARYFPGGVDVDGIFAFNDVGAMHIIHALQERGVRVPEDVGVVGFNSIAPGSIWTPPLATGNRKTKELASLLKEMVVTRLAQPDLPSRRDTVSMEFVWRASAGVKPNFNK